jgi:hypothetical protein
VPAATELDRQLGSDAPATDQDDPHGPVG